MESIQLHLNLDSGNAAIVEGSILDNLADLLQEQLVNRLRLGADYGNLRDANGNSVGSWNVYIDEEGS